jgi:flagellar hook-basal body complex protein FliE
MTWLPALQATQAIATYKSVDGGIAGDDAASAPGAAPASADAFSSVLSQSLGEAIGVGQDAEAKALGAVGGNGDLTQVVTAVSRAELALQTTVAVRDRVLQAYQDIIKMPI